MKRPIMIRLTVRSLPIRGWLAGQDGVSNTEIRQRISSFRLNRNDSLHITIHHIMSRDAVPGISVLVFNSGRDKSLNIISKEKQAKKYPYRIHSHTR